MMTPAVEARLDRADRMYEGAKGGTSVVIRREGPARTWGVLHQLGDELAMGGAAVIVLGESKSKQEVDADADELRRAIDAAARENARTQA
jgi:hypothetical protein